MLKHINELYGYKLNASDGDIGTIEDFYFDDQSWNVRYLVAETGTWLSELQVLISPYSIVRLGLDDTVIVVNLTRKQIEESPPIERHRPVSRQFETEYYTYYGWPYYWSNDDILGLGGNPMACTDASSESQVYEEQRLRDDTHLRSTLAVAGYEIETSDGTIGRAIDFLVDEKTWVIRELVVESGHWYSSKEILIPTGRIDRINYNESKIHVSLTKEDIQRTGENDIVHIRHD